MNSRFWNSESFAFDLQGIYYQLLVVFFTPLNELFLIYFSNTA
jgi:hypothetical protein